MLRDGELRAMRWRHLDEGNGVYFVKETHSRAHGFTTTKTASSEAEVPVPRVLLDEFTEHKRRQAEMRLGKGARWKDEGLIFTTSKGTALPHNWINKGLNAQIAQKAGVRYVSLHTLRKTGATILESLGVSRAETQVALRHKRPAVTDNYVSVYMEQRREHMEQVARLFTEPFPQSSLKVG
jgi:integrase